jgi:hypothetical protein
VIILHYLSLAYASLGVKAKQYEINLANATSSQQKIPIHLCLAAKIFIKTILTLAQEALLYFGYHFCSPSTKWEFP